MHKAIWKGKRETPSSNLLLVLITDREPRLCLWRFLCEGSSGLRGRSHREAADVVHTEPPKSFIHWISTVISRLVSHDASLQYSSAAWSLLY